MVQVSIHPVKNLNHGGRYYPFSGYLGLTKVLIEGTIRTRIEDDGKPMAASSITVSVKCYEARTKLTCSRVNTLVDITQVLWSSSDLESTDIGDTDHPFRVVLPSTVEGFSTITFPDYRVFWRLEASINHPPQFGLGTRQTRAYDLDFTRYHTHDSISSRTPQRPSPLLGYRLSSATHRCDPFYYRIDLPQTTVGPGDELPLSISMILDNEGMKIQPRSLSATLERRLELYEATGSHSHGDIESVDFSSSHTLLEKSELSSINTDISISGSSSTLFGTRKHSPNSGPILLPSRSIATAIVNAHASDFVTNKLDHVTASLNLALPAKPPPSQWPIGESLKTNLASIRFYLYVKIHVSTPSGPVDIPLEPVEVPFASTSQEQRSAATARIARKRALRSASAPSTRRSSPAHSSSGSSKGEPETPPPSSRSALSTDSSNLGSDIYSPSKYEMTKKEHPTRSSTSKASSLSKRRSQTPLKEQSFSSLFKRRKSESTSRPGTATLMNASSLTDSCHGSENISPHVIRAWEEELERIAIRSKRSSDGVWGGSVSDHDGGYHPARRKPYKHVHPPSAYNQNNSSVPFF